MLRGAVSAVEREVGSRLSAQVQEWAKLLRRLRNFVAENCIRRRGTNEQYVECGVGTILSCGCDYALLWDSATAKLRPSRFDLFLYHGGQPE